MSEPTSVLYCDYVFDVEVHPSRNFLENPAYVLIPTTLIPKPDEISKACSYEKQRVVYEYDAVTYKNIL